LARSVKDSQVFYALDASKSKASYDDFRAGFAEEYSALDKSFERLTERERLIGTMISDQAQMPASGRGN
jgi:hypothetical protein